VLYSAIQEPISSVSCPSKPLNLQVDIRNAKTDCKHLLTLSGLGRTALFTVFGCCGPARQIGV